MRDFPDKEIEIGETTRLENEKREEIIIPA